jgi:DNA-binding response OmpR family regulator
VRILVVEDEEDYRFLLLTALELAGMEVHEAADAATAIGMIGSLQPHAVLLDNWMPGQDGLDALNALRDAAPGVTVIMHTVDEENAMLLESHPAGPDAFVEKGLSPAQLRSRVLAAVRRHKEGQR